MAMFHELSVKEFKKKMEVYDDSVLIDVRTPEEIREYALEGHLVLNIMDPSFTTKIDALDREKSYFVYCRSGNRSGQACRYMLSQGFKKLYNLSGGIIAWQEEYE
ncbi:MAG: rhodanese-like domain-containing protein [Chitinophagales bacterium]